MSPVGPDCFPYGRLLKKPKIAFVRFHLSQVRYRPQARRRVWRGYWNLHASITFLGSNEATAFPRRRIPIPFNPNTVQYGGETMKTLAALVGTLALFSMSAPVLAMTDSECAAAWTQSGASADGTLMESSSPRYFAAMRTAQKPVTGGKITQSEFMTNCKAGVFSAVVAEAGAPFPGSNSFTEKQAQDRALAAGLSNISALKKDDNGIWRGTASSGGKSVSVAIDYKGNVVSK